MPKRLLLFFLLLLALVGCRKSTTVRSFYYWRTTFHLSPQEEKYLIDLNIQKIYLRMFDVDWDETVNSAKPIGKISFPGKLSLSYEYVPVVYLMNKTLQHINRSDITELAGRIFNQVQILVSQSKLSFKELQIDCDWSETTRDKYFQLLSLLKRELEQNHQTLSATIRLHQIKYMRITGVPPVHRGMLMYYNMGKIEATSDQNSIFNKKDAARYIGFVSQYPLPLDVALPAFAWGVHVRDTKVVELLNQMTPADFKNNVNFSQVDSRQFVVNTSFFYKGFYFMKDDRIKIEEVDPALCLEAAKQISGSLKNGPGSVAIFQLDTLMIKKYENKKLEKVFDCFH